MGVTNVCVIGAGHVGAPHAIMLAKKCPGVTVRVFDMDKRKIAAWNSSLLPFYEPSMQEMLEDVRGQNLFFTNDAEAAIRSAEMVFVSVSTPLKEGGIGAGYAPDLVNWEKIARMIASASNCPKIIVERSTVPVRTAGAMAKVLGFNTDHQMTVLSNPEFARQGVAITDIASPERVMIGGEQTPEGLRAIGALADLYAQWVPREKIIVSDLWSAELAKLAANAFLAQRISSINAISALCEKTNADVSEVAYAVGVDTRVGRKNLQAGVGFGGVCYETHLRNLIYLCRSRRLPQVAEYWESVLRINEWQKSRFAAGIVSAMFNTVSGKRLAIFGVAYTKNTDDTRFTPAWDVCSALLKERAQLAIYDPKVSREAINLALIDDSSVERLVHVERDPYIAATGAHALIVLTPWDELTRLDFKAIYDTMAKPAFVFDGRNLLQHDELRRIGFHVHGIGKPAADAALPAPPPLLTPLGSPPMSPLTTPLASPGAPHGSFGEGA